MCGKGFQWIKCDKRKQKAQHRIKNNRPAKGFCRKKLEEFRCGISEDSNIQFQDSKRGFGNKLQMCGKGFQWIKCDKRKQKAQHRIKNNRPAKGFCRKSRRTVQCQRNGRGNRIKLPVAVQ